MEQTPLHCPQPNAIESSSEVLLDLESLIDYLRSDRPVTEKTIFPRGTLMPDGRLDLCKQGLGVTGCHTKSGCQNLFSIYLAPAPLSQSGRGVGGEG